MSKLKSYSIKKTIIKQNEKAVTNYMGGISYTLSPLETLKIISTSSIFAEPSYYVETKIQPRGSRYNMSNFLLFDIDKTLTTDEIFINAVNSALDFDFKSTLDFAIQLRNEFYMRLNPSVIFVIAMMHPKRKEFNELNPTYMQNIAKNIINIPSDISNMFDFFMYSNDGKKNNMPSMLKRIFAKNLSDFSKYHISKYKSKSLIDIIRISHAKSEVINELMKTGKVEVNDNEKTWEQLRSSGMSWTDITKTIKIPHMALLRNLRNIFENKDDNKITTAEMKKLLTDLENGVKNGKQFPYRYYTAYKILSSSDVLFKQEILISLENCLDKSIENFPKLKGKTMCLCDNSGSAHGTVTSEYGTTKVAEIANLSSVMTAINCDEGYVGCFGDRLNVKEIKKNKRILEQLNSLQTNVGGSTENGIWLFLDKAIKTKEHFDNLFIYSDMQAGHGQLYGNNSREYSKYSFNGSYIDVMKLIDVYRKEVNPKLNVFSVQVAGYDNSVTPENIYRGAILSGWTGKEVLFAQKIINFWDEKESSQN